MVAVIVDDERFVRRGIIENIPWHSLGIETVIEARNGMDCLRKAEEIQPDILIADIRMPKLNGIDLGKEIASKYPKCKMIIISAYSEKEYLKSAISLNVVAYVEKPIVISELEEAVRKAVSKIREAENIQEENAAYRLYEDVLSQKMLSDTAGKLLRRISRDTAGYAAVLISSRESSLKYRELKGQMEERFAFPSISFFIYQDLLPHFYVLLAQYKGEGIFLDELTAGFEEAVREMEGDIFVSIGKTADSAEGIGESFASAQWGKYFLFQRGFHSVVYAGKVHEPEAYRIREEERKRMIGYFADGQKQELLTDLHKMFEDIKANGRIYSEMDIKHGFGELAEQFVRIERKGPLSKMRVWEKVFACRTAEDLEELFDQIIDISLPEDMVHNIVVKRMILIIVNEYADQNLSISYLCDRLGISRSKACGVFKEETGKTINEYITEYRINKAKQYIYDNLPLEDVAKMVGYYDGNYFSKIFKKVTGVTPTSYRRQAWND